jgi:hypothetical protein
MPTKPEKPHRIRVRTLDDKPRDLKEINRLRSNQLGMPHLDVVASNVPTELIICASKEAHIEKVRPKLGAAGLEEVQGDTAIVTRAAPQTTYGSAGYGGGQPGGPGGGSSGGGRSLTPKTDEVDLKKKPYGFVSLPAQLTTATPVWHDGTSSEGRLSGEVRFEIEALTPLLVGWERGRVGDEEHGDWPIESRPDEPGQSMNFAGRWSRPVATNKSVVCPLRAPWGERPVVIPGDSLKGLLRHELGALLGAPMERVAERSYSYRPNAMFAKPDRARLVARIARVPKEGIKMMPLDGTGGVQVRVPTQLEILPAGLNYDKRGKMTTNYYRFDDDSGAPYRGGQGAGDKLNSKRSLHTTLAAKPDTPTEKKEVPKEVQDGYLATIRHLIDEASGHFSERHPDAKEYGNDARSRILNAAKSVVFQPGDLIWVEWDKQNECIVSLGWHYYYRWAYIDSVRKKLGKLERDGLFPLPNERERDADSAPVGLSAVRRLFGYTGENDGTAGIGEGDHEQLMGRLFPNAALEIVAKGDTAETRFLAPTFLKELGMPRPSAVEHYLQQPHHPKSRPSDRAKLVTYGDAVGYDKPGKLAGRKFYLDRKDAYTGEPWKDDSDGNRLNDRSTLALEASKPGRRFRFTLRFRDLDPAELAAVLVALCPDQFKDVLGGAHADGYCSKLGYARPLGWGSVRIESKALFWLAEATERPTLISEEDLYGWVRKNHTKTVSQDEWLAIHRRNHPDAADYPRRRGEIHSFHSKLRAEHSRARRYSKGEDL